MDFQQITESLGMLDELITLKLTKIPAQFSIKAVIHENNCQKRIILEIRGTYLLEINPESFVINSGMEFTLQKRFNIIHQCHIKNFIKVQFYPTSNHKICYLFQNDEIFKQFHKQLGTKLIMQMNIKNMYKYQYSSKLNVAIGTRLEDGQAVAIKIFRKSKYSSCEKKRKILENQLTIVHSLNHPNVVKVASLHQSQNTIYLGCQKMEMTLFQFHKKHIHISHQHVKIIVYQILQGLKHIHGKGIIHRDISPNNIMIRMKNSLEIAIIDFGFSQFIDDQFIGLDCGTLYFTAPQVLNLEQGSKITEKCDIFSLGCIFHSLLFNRYLWEVGSKKAVCALNKQCNINQGADYLKICPDQIRQLLFKMLEKEPKMRISAEEALKHNYFSEMNDE